MYLKRLESVGFKSFAERIKVEFVPGVTAVVGPNGSGKSNITDAIRWVLGEQSVKSLRGLKMEDVIFQGSDTRKQLNFAEVTLVLDNSTQSLKLDYDEVSVTRRVYRSGSSEFYINKQSCRLKDIIDLFMDSGLGQEAFSIISQGRVEEVLSSKAEERRTIFEEAAGVLKYKQRKRKAEFKLSETEENLSRINDIVYEIEQQINPLEKQSQTAKIYLEQMDLLKKEEISLLITEIESLHKEWQRLLDQLEDQKMKEIGFKTAIQQKEAKLESDRQAIQKLDEEVDVLQESLLTMTQHLEQFEGKKQVLHERMKNFSENKEKLIDQKEQSNIRIKKLQVELASERERLAQLQSLKRKTNNQIKLLERQLTTEQGDLAEKIEELKAEYIESLNEQAAKRNEKQSIKQQLQQLRARTDHQSKKYHEMLELRKELENKQTHLSETFNKQENSFRKIEENLQISKSQLKDKRDDFERAQENLYKGYQIISNLNSRKEMLEEMKEDFQGFFHGVKSILKAKKSKDLTSIDGAVIELIEVPKNYVTAIETVLGGQAQHIVVKDDQAARDAISWLKRTNNGRSTFLPLASIQARFVGAELLKKAENHAGFVGIASELVKNDPAYQNVVNHLMGHVIITKTLRDANEIAKLTLRRHRIVTLDGDVVNPGGSMSGGAKKKTNQSLFTRESDLEEITTKLTKFQKKATDFEQMVEEKKHKIDYLEKELERKEDSISTEQQILQKTHASYKQVQIELESLNGNLLVYDQDQQQFDQDCDELIQREQTIDNELESIKLKLVSLQREVDHLTKQTNQLKENKDQIQQELHQNQVSLAEQEERVRSQEEKTWTIHQQLKEVEEQYTAYTKDLEELIHIQKEELSGREITDQIQVERKKIDHLTREIQKKRTTRVDKTQLMKDLEKELKEENIKHHTFVESIQKQEVKVNRLDVDLENKISQLQTEYTITFEMASQTYEKTNDLVETKKNVEQIKQTIQKLGTVNIGAIDEYERISERYTFLTKQKDDLVTAKQTLFSVIAEMDGVMKERFEHTFLQISKEFSIVFKELFGGGHAKLNLTDPKSLLDTGIEIIAQPPGKKLQQLGLLSGGERALTAISLLFSILRVRPVPFCVLDEVEAALDEANVVRFAKYVKMHSVDTQFIVITHRKGTMEEADVLYGVTMQESGVSRLVSVQLEETMNLVNS